jgi:uncharacterized protein (DUF1015 family)
MSRFDQEITVQTVVPFRAWRYDSQRAGDLGELVAPPYDVIGPELQSRLYGRSRYNVVRIDLGMTTSSDNDCDNQYTRAAAQLTDWKQAGVLARDPEPCLTFVEESFTGPDGRPRTRQGFLALIRLHDFDQGVIFPHEQTLSGPKEDRFRLMVATNMSLSPIFLLYDLPGDEITTAWRTGPGANPPQVSVVDPEGGPGATTTRLWRVCDPLLLKLVTGLLADGKFIIADGHHRYETALRYQRHRRDKASAARTKTSGAQQAQASCGEGPQAHDYALAYFSNLADPGLAIYGTHRLVHGLDPELISALPERLTDVFAVDRLTPAEEPVNAATATEAITRFLADHPRGAFGLWGMGLDAAYGLRLTDPDAVDAAVPGHSASYRELDVTILQALVMERHLGMTVADMAAQKHVTYFKEPADAFARMESGEFQAGFFMNPTGLDQVQKVAMGGERMPQKATFFYPKLPTGLVFHDLSDAL